MEQKQREGVRFVHLDILLDMSVQVYRYRLVKTVLVLVWLKHVWAQYHMVKRVDGLVGKYKFLS